MDATVPALHDPCCIFMKRAAPAKLSSESKVEVQVTTSPSMSMVQFGAAIDFPAMPSIVLVGSGSVCLTVGFDVVGSTEMIEKRNG